MIIKTVSNNTKTGRLRFRNDRKGRIILQVEYKRPDRYGDSMLTWRDAKIGDIQWREENE
jgi:hypothetical protein